MVIGLVAPLSGERGYLGTEVADGAALAVEDLNAAGGLLGAPVQLVVRDDRDLVSLPGQLADLAERDRVSAVIGPEAPGILLGERNPLTRRDVPAVLATAFAGDLADAGTALVRTVPSAADQARALGRWLSEVRAVDRIALLVADPVEGQVVTAALREGLANGGVEVAATVEADADAADLGPAVTRLRGAAGDAGAVLIWAPPPVAARATRAVRARGWDVQLAVPASAFVAEYRSLAGGASEGVVLPFPFDEDWFGAELEDWLLRWNRDHGLGALPGLDTLVLDLPVAAIAAYDAVGLVAEAVRAAGTREPDRVAAALRDVRHDGLLRTYRPAADGETWAPEDLFVARFHHLAVVFDADPRQDREQQEAFYRDQVELRYVPDEVLALPGGELLRSAIERRRASAPSYEPPLPPPQPVARPDSVP